MKLVGCDEVAHEKNLPRKKRENMRVILKKTCNFVIILMTIKKSL